MSTGKVLLGVLAGVAAGALIGVLLAPEKGNVIRKKILDQGEDITDELKTKFNEFIESMTEKYQSVKEEGKDYIKKGKSKVGETKDEFENLMS